MWARMYVRLGARQGLHTWGFVEDHGGLLRHRRLNHDGVVLDDGRGLPRVVVDHSGRRGHILLTGIRLLLLAGILLLLLLARVRHLGRCRRRVRGRRVDRLWYVLRLLHRCRVHWGRRVLRVAVVHRLGGHLERRCRCRHYRYRYFSTISSSIPGAAGSRDHLEIQKRRDIWDLEIQDPFFFWNHLEPASQPAYLASK